MKIERITINKIPSILWGEKSNKVFIAVHGNMSNYGPAVWAHILVY